MTQKAPTANAHRSDIDALRALAVGLVVLFHMSISTFDAGFVGVDVFFVLSGFLITGILNAELDRSGGVSLSRFWARRIRRLLPASTFTLLVVALSSFWLSSPLRWDQLSKTAVSALFYVSNFFFAGESADYFAADVKTNPLLHYWSLSVEEQFYVIWPVVFYLMGRFGARERGSRVKLGVAVGLMVISFAYSLYLTRTNGTVAYYSPFSRAWEFLAGATMAMTYHRLPRLTSARLRQLLALGGLALVLVSLFIVSATRDFPAPTGLLPVLGTLAFIYAQVDAADPLGRLMGLAPIQYLGRVSYSFYLWHWPFLVIGWEYFQSTSPALTVGLVLASLVMASLSHHLIENPVRFAKRLRPNRPNYALAGGLIVVGLLAAGLLQIRADAETNTSEFRALTSATDVWYAEELADFKCASSDLDHLGEFCTFGDTGSDEVLLVVGDSNAEHWLPALDQLGTKHGYAVVLRVRGSCPVQELRAPFTLDPSACSALQRETADVVQALQPDAVLVNQIGNYVDFVLDESAQATGEAQRRALWTAATAKLIDGLGDTPVGWLHSTPINDTNPIDCLAWRAEADCETDRTSALRAPSTEREWTEEAFGLVAVRPAALDLTDEFCDESRCPLILDDVIIYRDENHLTVEAAEKFAPSLEPFINELLADRPAST